MRPRSSGDRKFKKFTGPSITRTCHKVDEKIDFKDLPLLTRYLSPQGKMQSRKRTKYCAQCQRKFSEAIKRARYLALLPYTV